MCQTRKIHFSSNDYSYIFDLVYAMIAMICYGIDFCVTMRVNINIYNISDKSKPSYLLLFYYRSSLHFHDDLIKMSVRCLSGCMYIRTSVGIFMLSPAIAAEDILLLGCSSGHLCMIMY